MLDELTTAELVVRLIEDWTEEVASGSGPEKARARLDRLLVPSELSILRSVSAIYITIPAHRLGTLPWQKGVKNVLTYGRFFTKPDFFSRKTAGWL